MRPGSLSPQAPSRFGPWARSGWPFVPVAPLIVVLVGLAVALGIGCVGLRALENAGQDQAALRADLLADTVAARLAALGADQRADAVRLASRRGAAGLLVVTDDARVVYDATVSPPDGPALREILARGRGAATTRLGRSRFSVARLGRERQSVVAFVPETKPTSTVLLTSLFALATLLLSVAGATAYVVSRDVARDVEYVTRRVDAMAQVRSEPTGELVPLRTLDEVGLLTGAFNRLVGRFAIAEVAHHQDLARAELADRERAAFLAAVSHELRSPLNAILGFADILMEEVDGPLTPTAREEVEQIRGSGAHLLGLINDILELSAIESGQLKLSRADVDLTALAHEVMREARGLVGEKPIVVRVDAHVPVMAKVDARRVRQVLGNLVNNAIKFTQRGEVVVRVGVEGALASLSVSDTGPGISPTERAMIFEEYKQAGAERLRKRGTGLGLAIARRLVMLHHGSIQVESELGRGSTFKVLLPIGFGDDTSRRGRF